MTNGIRQEGSLSPLLFNIYINDLRLALSKQSAGCYCGKRMVNHIMYADNLVVFTPPALSPPDSAHASHSGAER